ncbi:MAG: MBL fold metallo-hydrolase [Deltaproteobacteria bacterium]
MNRRPKRKSVVNDIQTIDCHYLRPRFAAAYLMIEKDRASFIENNTSHAIPYLLEALKQNHLSPESVDYIIVTHAHLDHAGGTSALLQHCKSATVLAHPKAARTLMHPEKLIQSAKRVYGDEAFEKLYGNITPIPEAKVRSVQDGETFKWGNRILTFFYTLGHATHHMCLYDSKSQGVFTGDTFGLRYPDLQSQGLFIIPSTSPIDYDPDEAKKSIDKILTFNPTRLFLTHFGEVDDIANAKIQILKNLDVHESLFKWAQRNLALGENLVPHIEQQLKKAFQVFEKELELDLKLNAQGIAFGARK